jgi:hypothetical protein
MENGSIRPCISNIQTKEFASSVWKLLYSIYPQHIIYASYIKIFIYSYIYLTISLLY